MKWVVKILLRVPRSELPPRRGFILVLVYVDDLLLASRDEKEEGDFLQKLMGIWKIKLTEKIPALQRGVLQFLGRTIYREGMGSLH